MTRKEPFSHHIAFKMIIIQTKQYQKWEDEDTNLKRLTQKNITPFSRNSKCEQMEEYII